jgi:phosphoribosylaminoimidazolecarboxamide formyltransferase/IMP cyclohydrolase
MLQQNEINCFAEVVIAPEYDAETMKFYNKKNRIILIQNEVDSPQKQVRSCLNGL